MGPADYGAQFDSGGLVSLVEANAIEKGFGGSPVLQNVNLTVLPHQHILLLGPSGAGKSTLLSILGGLSSPDAGVVQFRGAPYPAPRKSAEFRREHVGFLFQDFHLIEHLSAIENVELIRAAFGIHEESVKPADLLRELGLAKQMNAPVHVLSRGERQRVALARAFANNPTLLLADEPTASLDPSISAQTMSHVWKLCEAIGTTAVIVSHDQALRTDSSFSQRLTLQNGSLHPEDSPGHH